MRGSSRYVDIVTRKNRLRNGSPFRGEREAPHSAATGTGSALSWCHQPEKAPGFPCWSFWVETVTLDTTSFSFERQRLQSTSGTNSVRLILDPLLVNKVFLLRLSFKSCAYECCQSKENGLCTHEFYLQQSFC